MTREIREQIEKLKVSKSEGDRRTCIPLLQEYLKENPDDAVAWYDLAGCFDFCGFEKEAEPCYWKTYELGWKQLPPQEQLGFLIGFGSTLRNNLKFAESEKILMNAIGLFPDYPALKVFLAFTQYSMGQYQQSAQTLFSAQLQMPPKAFDGYERAIQCYVENLETYPVKTEK